MRDYVIVRFKCNRGALMSGDGTVYCDGHQWNSTRPDCLGSASFFAPNSHPMLSVPPAAPILSLPNPGRSVQVGQRLTFTCRSQGGSSVKSLGLAIIHMMQSHADNEKVHIKKTK